MLDTDLDGDEQDLAEAFDETHREGEDPSRYDDEDALDPDLDGRAYDATSAMGDEAEDEDDDDDLDDDDDDVLDEDEELDEEEEDSDEARGEGLLADEPEADLFDGDQRADIAAPPDEPDLVLNEDLDNVAPARDRRADKYESAGPLSDEQISDLGYGAKARGDSRLD